MRQRLITEHWEAVSLRAPLHDASPNPENQGMYLRMNEYGQHGKVLEVARAPAPAPAGP